MVFPHQLLLVSTTTSIMILVQVLWFWYRFYDSGTGFMILVQVLWFWYKYYDSSTSIMILVQVLWFWYRYYDSSTSIMILVQVFPAAGDLKGLCRVIATQVMRVTRLGEGISRWIGKVGWKWDEVGCLGRHSELIGTELQAAAHPAIEWALNSGFK